MFLLLNVTGKICDLKHLENKIVKRAKIMAAGYAYNSNCTSAVYVLEPKNLKALKLTLAHTSKHKPIQFKLLGWVGSFSDLAVFNIVSMLK